MKKVNNSLPEHVAIIMDGNGRWAKSKKLSRIKGHQAGVESVREIVEFCREKSIRVLSLFAFSSENWRRPESEVLALMELFARVIKREISKLNQNNIRLRFIGDKTRFSKKLIEMMQKAEEITKENNGLTLVVAINYGGRWDILNAVKKLGEKIESKEITSQEISESEFCQYLSLGELPDPDLFIRTSGEIRLSNFFLWQLAYTELYFVDILWPDFKKSEFEKALNYYATKQRRFGYTSEQVEQLERA